MAIFSNKGNQSTAFSLVNSLLFSLIFSFHILISSQPQANNGSALMSYLCSLPFASWFTAITAALFMFSLFMLSKNASGAIQKDKVITVVLTALLLLSFALSFLRNTDRGWHAVFNSLLAAAVVLLYYRFGAFGEGTLKDGSRWPFYLLAGACAVFIAIASGSGFLSQDSFSTFPKDMGIFNNLIWRLGYDGSQFTVTEGLKDHRAVHFQPVLYLLALVFKIKCSPYILIFLQVFFAMAASIFLYLLAGLVLKNAGAAFFIALAYLTSTYTARTFIYDYHPESMYMTMFFAFLYYAGRGKFLYSAVFFCLAASVKEEAAFYAALAGLFVYFQNKDKRYLLLSACSFIYFGAVIAAVMPSFGAGGPGWVQYLAANSVNLFKPENAGSLLFQLFIFLMSAAFIPVLCAAPLLLLLPPVITHCANYRDPSHLLFNMWYASFVTPALFSALVYSLKSLADKNKNIREHVFLASFMIFVLQAQFHLAFMSVFSPAYSAAVCAAALALFILPQFKFAAAPKTAFPALALTALAVFYFGYCGFHRSRMGNVPGAGRESIKKAMSYIPESADSAVLTNSNIVTHLCCRKYVWAMDTGGAEDVFEPVIRENLDKFYMLVYLYDFTYKDNKIEPEARNMEIAALAQKSGFSYRFLYNDNITGVLEFYRPENTGP